MTLLDIDLDEGRSLILGCRECRSDVRAYLAIASPFRFYVAALVCPECGIELLEWDAIAETVVQP
jgi:hypothetical protein